MSILEIIALLVFLGSVSGMLAIFWRKAPVLANLPKITLISEKKQNVLLIFLTKTREKLKTLPWLKNFSPETFLQKLLSKIRILTLKLESKTGHWLEFLRKKAQSDRAQKQNNDDYWQNLENSQEKKDSNDQPA
jgi:hypothetical protein